VSGAGDFGETEREHHQLPAEPHAREQCPRSARRRRNSQHFQRRLRAARRSHRHSGVLQMKQMIRLALLIVVVSLASASASAQAGPYSFFAITPCRAVDTRGGSPLGTGQTRNFAIRNVCGVPSTASAVTINVTITGATTQSFLT